MQIFVKVLTVIACVLYFSSVILYTIKKRFLSFSLTFIAWIINLGIVIINWKYNGYVPFVSMSQVMIFMAMVFPIVFQFVKYVLKEPNLEPWFSLCSGIFCLGVSFMDQKLIWHFPPALQSLFFVPHVMSYMLSYSLCAVSFCLTIFSIILRIKKKDEKIIASNDKAVYKLIITAFPFMVCGMCLGALWADNCWGNYWEWDPKETWALITVLGYSLYLHLRKIPKCDKFLNPILIFSFFALIMTFFGVSALNMGGIHSY